VLWLSVYGEDLASVIFRYNPNDKKINDNLIYGIEFWNYSESKNIGVYIAGISTGDTVEKLQNKLGEPTSVVNGKDSDTYNYIFAYEHYISFKVRNGKIVNFDIQLPWK